MSELRFGISMSLDGFVAGPDQSVANPLGVGGHRLHEWLFALAAWREQAGLTGGETNASTPFAGDSDGLGAVIVGRNMFGGGPGPWTGTSPDAEPWQGWWGEDPPFHRPVFVLTHHERAPLQMLGGTSFTFVTGGIHEALDTARQAAGGKHVGLYGGGSTARQYLAAGLVTEVRISLVPVLLGGGVRLLDGPELAGVALEQVRAVEAPGVTHLVYRVTS
ncbi:MAG TPA: dihydrofolate reductase family protein [Streptosporangiaceae bacterium]|nr:dihydrofolate reductase family protein [Streptosporangiaceae bacterium]